MSSSPSPVEHIRAYHARTRHHPHAYARAMGFLDWDLQPDPFRRFAGAPLVPLVLVPPGEGGQGMVDPPWSLALEESGVPPAPLTAASVGRLLQDALGLSAWKQFEGARWSLRVNPSSGNLHPTEGYVVAGALPGVSDAPFVAHYAVHEHALELRSAVPDWERFAADLPAGALLIGLTSIPWRESWKYGERAFRYCQHDLGHAIAGVAVAAAALGWAVRVLEGPPDAAGASLLGLVDDGGPEVERFETLLAVYPAGRDFPVPQQRHLRLPRPGPRVGTPNALSSDHHAWPVIDLAALATERPEPAPAAWWARPSPGTPPPAGQPTSPPAPRAPGDPPPPTARTIVHQRRSAVALDGATHLDAAAFFDLLATLVPQPGRVPFAALPWAPRVHPVLFVHRVHGVEQGLYALCRDPEAEPRLRAALDARFGWEGVPGAPDGLPLRRLWAGDVRGDARELCCGQDIAADGAFAVAMLAELGPTLDTFGAWTWRRLHWEAGAVGQMLYLGAEAAGVRGTGIGCFLDEPTHRRLGVRDDAWRTLYHFTLGGPVDDARLRTLAPYAHLGPRGGSGVAEQGSAG